MEFTLEPTANNLLFDRHVYGKAGQTLPPFVEELIRQEKKEA